MKIRRNTLFVVYFMELLVALSYSCGSCFAFVGFACFYTGGFFFLWRSLQCHSVLGDVAQKKKGKRTHKLSNSNHTVCEDLSFLRLSNIPQGKMVYVQWQ